MLGRRFATSAATLVIGLVLFTGAQLAGESPGADDAAGAVSLPPIHHRDQGVYVRQGSQGIEDASPDAFMFKFHHFKAFADEHGTRHPARLLLIQFYERRGDLLEPTTGNAFWVHADTHAVIAAGKVHTDYSSHGCLPVMCELREDLLTLELRYGSEIEVAPICGLLHPFADAPAPLGHSTFVGGECDWPHGERVPALYATGTRETTIEGKPALRFVSDLAHTANELWFAEDQPYPTQIVMPEPAPVWHLVEFTRGDAHPVTFETDGAPPTITYAARPRLGMDDSAARPWFSFGEAVNAAKLLSDLDGFLETHPDAYVFHASYEQDHGEPIVVYRARWTFGVGDGVETQWYRIQKQTVVYQQDAPGMVEVLPPPTMPPVKVPAWSNVSHRTPTLSSLMDTWQWHLNTDFGYFTVHYGWDTTCVDDGCSKGETLYWVGRIEALSFVGLGDEEERIQLFQNGSLLAIDDNGRADRLLLWDQRTDTVAMPDGSGPQPRWKSLSASSPTPAFDRDLAAGLWLTAFLAALAYSFWPALRGAAAWAFFSRIAAPDILQHPTRATIHALVLQEPGIHFREIRRRLAIPHGSLMHHLRKLDKSGILAVERSPSATRYFIATSTAPERRRTVAQRQTRAMEVLRWVAKTESSTIADLARHLDITRQSAHEQIRRLERDHLVERSPSKQIRLSPMGRELLAGQSPQPAD